MDIVESKAKSADETIQLFEKHYLRKRARRVNDEVWMQLSFDMIKAKRVSKSLGVSHESILIELLNETSELVDFRDGIDI